MWCNQTLVFNIFYFYIYLYRNKRLPRAYIILIIIISDVQTHAVAEVPISYISHPSNARACEYRKTNIFFGFILFFIFYQVHFLGGNRPYDNDAVYAFRDFYPFRFTRIILSSQYTRHNKTIKYLTIKSSLGNILVYIYIYT